MSSDERTNSPENYEWVSLCVLSLCLGCSKCQNATALLATKQIDNINAHIERLTQERETLLATKAAFCNHHWSVSYASGSRVETCSRCQTNQ
jgi:hypothetical protein